ncbi:MAG: 30S ribosomal protein S1, partial [Chloroflexi bacterium]|nr:30S ribosomal protein S1 [Chloroflexota bacterium]
MTQNTQDDSPQNMQQILDQMEFETLRRGEIVEGTIMRADTDGIFLDIGHKEEGFIPPNEMRTISGEELLSFEEGDPLIAFILRPDSQDGPILSVDRARGEEG